MKFSHPTVWALALTAPLLAQAGAMHKCVQGQTVVYTDKPCPSEQQTRAVSGGSVSTANAVKTSSRGEPAEEQTRSGKPVVPYFARQKSVEDSLKERAIRR